MAGDRARISHSPARKYREMVGLQGRVLLEADLNEGQRVFSEEVRHHALDFVGPCGTPDDGYEITAPPADFQIGAGTMYVAGIRNTLEQPITYSTQKDWLDNANPQPWADDLWLLPNQLNQGNSHVMLLLQELEITAVEDPALREVALGGPDSAARTRILQRVIAAPTGGASCATAAAGMAAFWSGHGLIYHAQTASLRSRARLKVSMVQNAPPPSPCDPPAASGYLGADNQMIRAQLVAFDQATGKGKIVWAYNNASVLYRVKALDATTLELASKPVSPEFEPRSGQVAQVSFSAAEIAPAVPNVFPDGAFAAAITGFRAKLNAPYAPETARVTLPAALPAVFPRNTVTPPLFLRLWEEELDFDLNAPVTLTGTGLQVTISASNAGMLHVGDYWSIAVRPLTPNALYPDRYLAAPQPPDGPRMWVCSLAVLRPQAGAVGLFQVDDCRVPFDPLTAPHPQGAQTDCCCIKVTPKDAPNLQKIVDKAIESDFGAGVTIHLEPGLYRLRTPLLLTRKHKGIVIQSCSGAKPVLTGGDESQFASGVILATEVEDVTIRGLEFRTVPSKLPDEWRALMESVGKSQIPGFGSPPRGVAIGINAVSCLSLNVEDCDFRAPKVEAVFGIGILLRGDNGGIDISGCRFDGAIADGIGVCLTPLMMNVDGLIELSSVEVLKITDCVFARLQMAMLLSSRPLLTFLERNTSRYVHNSLLLLWFEEKVFLVKHIFELMNATPGTKSVQDYVAAFLKEPILMQVLGWALLLPAGEPNAKRSFLYTLVDLSADEAAQTGFAPPPTLRLTLDGNQFDSRRKDGQSASDTVIWDLTSNTSNVTITGNTVWNRSALATMAVLRCDAFNATGNVAGNETPTNNAGRIALIVFPVAGASAGRPIQMFTVTGNTITGSTNLADFPRQEWVTQLSKEFAPLLTWEFFNTIA